MNRSEWPAWAPPEAINYYDECFDEGYSEANDLKKLLTDSTADELIWQKLKKLRIEPKNFCIAFVEAMSGYLLIDKTSGEYSEYFTKVSTKSLELSKLVSQFQELDQLPIKHYSDAINRMKDRGVLLGFEIDPVVYMPLLVSELLREISEKANDSILDSGDRALLLKPFNNKAQKNFFIKKLTQFFRAKTGKPSTGIVKTCLEVCFNDFDTTKKQIEDLTQLLK